MMVSPWATILFVPELRYYLSPDVHFDTLIFFECKTHLTHTITLSTDRIRVKDIHCYISIQANQFN